jgi:hypothetical protein
MHNEYKVSVEHRDPKSGYHPINVYVELPSGLAVDAYHGKSLNAGLKAAMDVIFTRDNAMAQGR